MLPITAIQPVHLLSPDRVLLALVQKEAVVVKGINVLGILLERPLVHNLHVVEISLQVQADCSELENRLGKNRLTAISSRVAPVLLNPGCFDSFLLASFAALDYFATC